MRLRRVGEQGDAARSRPCSLSQLPGAAPVHLRGAVLVDDDHAVLHAWDRHVEGGVAITAQAHPLPTQGSAVQGELAGDPARQLVRGASLSDSGPTRASTRRRARRCRPRLGASILGAPRPSSVQKASPLWPACAKRLSPRPQAFSVGEGTNSARHRTPVAGETGAGGASVPRLNRRAQAPRRWQRRQTESVLIGAKIRL